MTTAPCAAVWAVCLWGLCLLQGSLTAEAFLGVTVSRASSHDVWRSSSGTFLLTKSSTAADDPASVTDARPSSSLPSRSKRRKAGKKRKQPPSDAAATALQEVEDADIQMSQFLIGSNMLFRKMKMEGTVGEAEAAAESSEAVAATAAPTGPRHLDCRPVLVLNADYQPVSLLPLSLWHWQEAIKAVCAGKVTVVDVYPDVMIRSVRAALRLPSVIALREYVPVRRRTTHRTSSREATAPAFSKRNVFLRDGFRCQYCRRRFGGRDLSLDHVTPRSRGGRLEWTNAVACCRPCNNRKGSLTLPELERATGMRLAQPPVVPTTFELARKAAGLLEARRLHDSWRPYLGVLEEAEPEESDGAIGERGPLSMAHVLVQD